MDERAQMGALHLSDISLSDPQLYRLQEQFRKQVFSAGKPEPATPKSALKGSASEPRLSPLHNSPLSTPRSPSARSLKLTPRSASTPRLTPKPAMYSIGIGGKSSNQLGKSTFWQPPPENLDRLKERLQVEDGTLFVAWQKLDKEARGFLGRETFRRALVEAGFNGRFGVLWSSLDAFGHGVITLAELDRSVARDLQQLKRRTGTSLRSMLLRMGFHADLSITELAAAFAFLGCSHPEVLALQFAPQGHPVTQSISWFDKWNTDIPPSAREMNEFNHEAEGMAFADEMANSRVKLSNGLHIPVMTARAQQYATERWQQRHSREMKEAQAKATDVAPTTIHQVLHRLKVRHGNLIRAWRREIEADACFIGWRRFVMRLRHLNFHGNLSEALVDVHAEETGVVELAAFAPEDWDLLVDFRRWSEEQFGTAQATWDAIDNNKMSRVPRSNFAQRLEALGWKGDGKEVFDVLVLDSQSGSTGHGDYNAIQQSTFMWIDKVRHGPRPGLNKSDEEDDSSDDGHPSDVTTRNPHRRASSVHIGGGLKMPAPTARAAEWQEAGKKWRQEQRDQKALNQKLDSKTSSIEAFKKMLCQRHGNLVRAWRMMFDKTGKGTMGRMNFVRALQKMHYGGDLSEAWKMLDTKGQNIITLTEFAPAEAARLTEFRRCLHKRFGDARSAYQALDMNKTTRLSKSAFIRAVKLQLDFRGDTGQIFDYLQMSDTKTACLTIDEFVWLDYWHNRAEGATPQAASQPAPSSGSNSARRSGSQSARSSARISRSNSARKSKKGLDTSGPSLNEILRDEMEDRMGHVGRAWRKHLDPHGMGILKWFDFLSGMKEMGCSMNLPMVWATVRCGNRSITLQHLDAELNDALLRLYGALADPELPDSFCLFQNSANTDINQIPVTLEEYSAVLSSLGMESDTSITFQGLMEPKGRFVEPGAFQWLSNWGAACISGGFGLSGLCISHRVQEDKEAEKRRSNGVLAAQALGTAHMDLVLRRHLGIAAGSQYKALQTQSSNHELSNHSIHAF